MPRTPPPLLLPLLALLALLAALAGCSKQPPESEPLTGGNPRLGRQLIARYGCAACHEIKGIAHADSKVGPSLKDTRERGYIAGVVPNTAPNLIQWIQHPRDIDPKSAMPDLGVSEADARDMAAYLYAQ
jgi:cytochrome c2